MRKVIYTALITILGIFFFQACSKEEDTLQGNSEQLLLQDSLQVENRNGTVSPIWYLNSNSFSYHQKNYQVAFNKDSILNVEFSRSTGAAAGYTASLGTLDPAWSNKPARKYDIIVTLRGVGYSYPSTWIADTTATSFNKIGNTNLFKGTFRVYRTDKNLASMQYYDTNYQKLKTKFLYAVKLDTLTYQDYIPANSTGTVFWLNHKMK